MDGEAEEREHTERQASMAKGAQCCPNQFLQVPVSRDQALPEVVRLLFYFIPTQIHG